MSIAATLMRLLAGSIERMQAEPMSESNDPAVVTAEAISSNTGTGLPPADGIALADVAAQSFAGSLMPSPQNREARERLALQMHQTMLRKGITPADLAAKAGLPTDTVVGLVFGGSPDISLTNLEVIAQVFGLKFDFALTAQTTVPQTRAG